MYNSLNDSITELRNSMDIVMRNINMADLSVYADETPVHHIIKAIQCAEEVREMSKELNESNSLLNTLVRKKLDELSKMDLWRVCSEAKRGGIDISAEELLLKVKTNSLSLKELILITRILNRYE